MPDRFNGWIVDKPLNGGAQAFVYRVHKEGETVPHVLKLLKPWSRDSKQSSEREQRSRFITEVSTLKTLQLIECPRVVRVVASNLDLESVGPLWYVMPFYEGGAMRRITDEGEPGDFAEDYTGAVDRVLSIAADLAETVEVMHSGSPQIVHRDIHTQNIFFEETCGPPILGDFGLAAMGKSPKVGGTAIKEAFGPRRWRPAEMRSGSDYKRDPASDVYMIGGVIYEALSGGNFIEDTLDVYGLFVHEKDVFDLTNYSDDPRVPLITMMLRSCFVRNPDARFSASELRKACLGILKWKLHEPPPDIGERQSRMAAAEEGARGASQQLWDQKQRAELYKMVKFVQDEIVAARNEIDTGGSQKAYEFWTRVDINGFRANAKNAFYEFTDGNIHNPDFPVVCLGVAVSFAPEPKVQLDSSTLIWRDATQEYVAVVTEEGISDMKSQSFHGDPAHATLVRQIATEEIDRLQDLATQTVNELAGKFRD